MPRGRFGTLFVEATPSVHTNLRGISAETVDASPRLAHEAEDLSSVFCSNRGDQVLHGIAHLQFLHGAIEPVLHDDRPQGVDLDVSAAEVPAP